MPAWKKVLVSGSAASLQSLYVSGSITGSSLLLAGSAAGSTILDIQGTQGQLFSVTDSLTGDIFKVSDISGIPILTVNSSGLVSIDGTLTATSASFSNLTDGYIPYQTSTGLADSGVFYSGSNIGIGTTTFTDKLTVAGSIRVSGGYSSFKIGRTTTEGSLNVASATNDYQTGAQAGDVILRAETAANKLMLGSGVGTGVVVTGSNVGIGVTNPASKLQIGSVGSTNYAVPSGLAFGDGTRAGALNVDSTGTILYSSTNLTFSPGTTTRMFLSSSGNVGIGTTTPISRTTIQTTDTGSNTPLVIGQPLNTNEYTGIGFQGYVAGNAAIKSGIIHNRTANYGVGDLQFAVNNVSDNTNFTASDVKLTIKSTGNVGIGITSPGAQLHVSSSVLIGNSTVYNEAGYNILTMRDTSKSSMLRMYYQTTDIGAIYSTSTGFNLSSLGATSLTLHTNGLARMTVSSSGYVGIGTTTPGTLLDVTGHIRTNAQLISTIATGTAPLAITSTTQVNNLNVDLLDGLHGADYVSKAHDIVLTQFNQYYYMQFGQITIPSGSASYQNPWIILMQGVEVASDHKKYGHIKLHIRRNTNNTSDIIYTVANLGTEKVDTLYLTTDDHIVFKLYYKVQTKTSYTGFYRFKVLQGTNILTNSGTHIAVDVPPSGSLFTLVATEGGFAGSSINGTTNYIPKFTGVGTLGNSLIYDSGTSIGIGTTTPTEKLTVLGNASFGSNASSRSTNGVSIVTNINNSSDSAPTDNSRTLLVENSNSTLNSFSSITLRTDASGGGSWYDIIYKKTGASIGSAIHKVQNGDVMSLLSNGNVGIGTTTPNAKLDVNGNTVISGSITSTTISQATTNTDKFLTSDGGIVKYISGSQLLSYIGGQASGNYVTTDTAQTITGAKIIQDLTIGSPLKTIKYQPAASVNLPAVGDRALILTVGLSSLIRVTMLGSENGQIQPFTLLITRDNTGNNIHIQKDDPYFHTHSRDILFSYDTVTGNIYAEKSLTTTRYIEVSSIEVLKGTATAQDGNTVIPGVGEDFTTTYVGKAIQVSEDSVNLNGGTTINGGDLFLNTNGISARFSTYKPSGGDGYNIFIGGGGQNSITSSVVYEGSHNVSLGANSLINNTSGYHNTSIGKNSLLANTAGYYNVAVGSTALYSNTLGNRNTSIGTDSFRSSVNASNGVAVGFESQRNVNSQVTGWTNYNTSTGYQSLRGSTTPANNTGNYNTAFGYQTLFSVSTGERNVAVGNSSQYNTIIGGYNTSIGDSSLYYNVSGSSNTALGYHALYFGVAGYSGTAIGYNSQRYVNNQTGSWTNYNTSVGYESLRGSTTPANNTGNYNTALGYQSLLVNTIGERNTGVGAFSLAANTTGTQNTTLGYGTLPVNTTGYSNTAVGYTALFYNITGNYNTAVGNSAGRHSKDNTTANSGSSNSVYIGYATKALADGDTNEIVIGYDAIGNGSNTVTLGNDSVTKTILKGNVGIGTTSPSEKLYVQGGNVQIIGATDSAYYKANDTTNGVSVWFGVSSAIRGFIGTLSNHSLGFRTNNTDRLLIDNSGSVGIGTTSPTAKLEVSGSIKVNSGIYSSKTSANSPVEVYSVGYTGHTCMIVDYTVVNAGGTAQRSGTLTCNFNSSAITHSETATPDLGTSTSAVTFTTMVGMGAARVYANITGTDTWTIKVSARYF